MLDASEGLLISNIDIPRRAWALMNDLRVSFINNHMVGIKCSDEQVSNARMDIVAQTAGLNGSNETTNFTISRPIHHTFEWESENGQPELWQGDKSQQQIQKLERNNVPKVKQQEHQEQQEQQMLLSPTLLNFLDTIIDLEAAADSNPLSLQSSDTLAHGKIDDMNLFV